MTQLLYQPHKYLSLVICTRLDTIGLIPLYLEAKYLNPEVQ